MILEPKHLAPYIPYYIKIQTPSNSKFTATHMLGIRENGYGVVFVKDGFLKDHRIEKVKPILRPLSNLKEFIPATMDYGNLNNKKNVLQMDYIEVEFLLEHHFDVFGLIEEGLAIDVNRI